jgi:predicted ATP-grasp superfamily ATP-dependent carboligase
VIRSIYILGNHIQALGAARMADSINLKVTLFSDYGASITRFSNACQSFIRFRDENHLYEILMAMNTGEEKPVLLPTNDRLVSFLGRHYKSLSEKYLISVPEPRILDICLNKRLTYQAGQRLGVPVPESLFPDSYEELTQIAEKIHYPVIIKPAIMHTFYANTGRKVFICNNPLQLKEKYNIALKYIPANEIIIQEFLTGGAKNLYSFGSFSVNGTPWGSLIANRIRQKPMNFGISTTYAKTVVLPELDNLAVKMLKGINYTGISEVEFMYDTLTGNYKLLEINSRTWKWHSLSNLVGINFIEQMINHMQGNAPDYITNNKDGLVWIERVTDLWVFITEFLRGRISFNEYISSLKVKKEYATWSGKDPWPAIFYVLLTPYLLFKR